MAISISNALGAFTQAQTGLANSQGEATLLDFINKINQYGVTLKAKYEVNFSGIEGLTFFVSDISVPDVRQNFGNVWFEGKTVEIPINIEYGHDMTMTLLNDGKGIIYSTILNWIMNQDAGDSPVDSGYTMTIRQLGDNEEHKGMTITLKGVRMKNITGLNFASNDASISTFTLTLSAISFTATMGSLQTISGFAGALKTLFGINKVGDVLNVFK